LTTNAQILEALNITARLMELHGENPFKTRAYTNAAFRLGKLRYDFEGKTQAEIESIEGIGKGISAKIFELATTGKTSDLTSLLDRTPPGVIQMLGIKGLGPKKVRQLWLELNCESIGELLYACNENRLLTLKGFGEKTQEQVRQSVEFKLGNNNRFHYAVVIAAVTKLIEAIRKAAPAMLVEVTGELARKNEIIENVQVLLSAPLPGDFSELEAGVPLPVQYIFCAPSEFARRSVEHSAVATHLDQIRFADLPPGEHLDERSVYDALGLQFIAPELREGRGEVELARQGKLPGLIAYDDLKGVLHNHSTWSDGVDSLQDMADFCRSQGFTYLGICDHSRTAVYARGLSVERVFEQQAEIDRLNNSYSDFRILKGIESDILGDGSLDYPDEVLKTFDFVVASVHSNLKMSEEKATARLLRAIENPYTSILGHPSGRLLLSRPGYPLDYRKIIDACAANKVDIELNAHPYRLDIDWRWISYCLEKGVMISINPDAHHRQGVLDMKYGVAVARKGMLGPAECLNALPLQQLLQRFRKQLR
jgi:DNA polymerase (family X)